jgi:hypothetical protein
MVAVFTILKMECVLVMIVGNERCSKKLEAFLAFVEGEFRCNSKVDTLGRKVNEYQS